jgi:hypothetical protein
MIVAPEKSVFLIIAPLFQTRGVCRIAISGGRKWCFILIERCCN